jgi:hypothetical protein
MPCHRNATAAPAMLASAVTPPNIALILIAPSNVCKDAVLVDYQDYH